MIVVLIPARLASSRLPRKLLLDVGGRPLLWHTVQRAKESAANQVIVLTEDCEIHDVLMALGEKVLLTAPATSGTERISRFVLDRLGRGELNYGDVVVNFQGDEPELPGYYAAALATVLQQDLCSVATLASPATAEEFQSPSVVKVVVNRSSEAMYFSRSPIPYGGVGLKHIGLYAYRASFFRELEQLPPTLLASERLEQLQWLENGIKIKVLIDKVHSASIDVPEDYERLLRRQGHADRLQQDRI